MASAVFSVVKCQEDLGNGELVGGERLLPGVGKPDLAGRGRGLFLFKGKDPVWQIQVMPPDRDRSGRHDYDADGIGISGAQYHWPTRRASPASTLRTCHR